MAVRDVAKTKRVVEEPLGPQTTDIRIVGAGRLLIDLYHIVLPGAILPNTRSLGFATYCSSRVDMLLRLTDAHPIN